LKINIFGKKMDIKAEVVVISTSVLILLGCLAGYVFFRDSSDIIIESGTVGTAGYTRTDVAPEPAVSKSAPFLNQTEGTLDSSAGTGSNGASGSDGNYSAGNIAASAGDIPQNDLLSPLLHCFAELQVQIAVVQTRGIYLNCGS
jgi:hypothetical protein